MTEPPKHRIRTLNDRPVNDGGNFVLYWMVAARRTHWNFGLQHAVSLANRQEKPLLILEALRCDYRWSSARQHQFFIQGMIDNLSAAESHGVRYLSYVEKKKGQGKGLLAAISKLATCVVTDDYPCIFVPKMLKAAAEAISVPLDAVDSNGLVPIHQPEKTFARAYDFRRYFQKNAKEFLASTPDSDPLAKLNNKTRPHLPSDLTGQWEMIDPNDWDLDSFATIEFQEDVAPVEMKGGSVAAQKRLKTFVKHDLKRYNDGRRDLDRCSTSGLSPYLRFGHISAHQIANEVLEHEDWKPTQLAEKVTGSNSGFWGTGEDAEAFLDELISWREVGYNMSAREADYDQYESLPEWAKESLSEHRLDDRPSLYSLKDFENAETHDDLWNAAQNQLRRDGHIHNYMRMVWGKKILHWSKSPQEALDIMIHLNNKYAIDGRDPNSYSGIFWCLGRYDRAWGPEREVFGKIRYMSEENTRKKLSVDDYIKRYS